MNFLTIFFIVLGFIILSAILIAIYKVKHKNHYTGNHSDMNDEGYNIADSCRSHTDATYALLPGNMFHDDH